jgi:amino acid transporter
VHGFIAGWLSWIPIFLLLPLDASVVVAHLQYALGQEWGIALQVGCQIAYVWMLLLVCALRLRISQAVVNISFFVAIGIALTALVVGLMHGRPVTPIDQEIFSFDLRKYGFLYSAAVLWLLGVEIPFNMGAEFSDHKKSGKTMFIWGTFALIIGYVMGIVSILFSTPVTQIDQTTGISRAIGTISPMTGAIIAILTSLAAFAQATTAMNAYSRLPFVGGVEERLPRLMMRVSMLGKTPWPAMLVQAIGGTIVILIFATQTKLVVTFNLYLAALVAVWCASLFYIYVGLIHARKLYKNLYIERRGEVWKIPGGKIGLWSCVLGGSFFNALAIYFVFAKPWVDGISRRDWCIWLGVTTTVITLVGAVVYFLGKRYERQ